MTIGMIRTATFRIVARPRSLSATSDHKRISLGTGLVTLAEPVEQDLRTLARPVLEGLADAVGATAHLVVRESEHEARALMVVEPRRATVHIAFRPGQSIPIERGSAAMAILSALPPVEGERPEIAEGRRRGWAISEGEVVPTTIGISAPVPARRGGPQAAIGISVFDDTRAEEQAAAVTAAARELGELLR